MEKICSLGTSVLPISCALKRKRTVSNIPEHQTPVFIYQVEETALAEANNATKIESAHAVATEDFEVAMRAMAKLRPSVDAFFDKVTVNVDDKPVRENRLKLLNEIREATRAVADFSRIEG